MGEQHGFTVQAYDTQPDATQAVLSGRAYATLGGNTTIVYAASKNPNFIADLELKDTRAHWAAPFRKDSALRNQMQDVINCMKKDGTIAKLSERWFGKPPPPDGLERVITPGYGVPGMPGYDPTPHWPEVLVEARGLHKHYGALHVLKGVDLVVAERELVFIIGPSGSGKSTLLRCLNRLEVPSSEACGWTASTFSTRAPTSTMRASASAWCSSRSTSIRT